MAGYDLETKYVNKVEVWHKIQAYFYNSIRPEVWQDTKYVNKAVDRAGGWSHPRHFHQSPDPQLSPLPLYCIYTIFPLYLHCISIVISFVLLYFSIL